MTNLFAEKLRISTQHNINKNIKFFHLSCFCSTQSLNKMISSINSQSVFCLFFFVYLSFPTTPSSYSFCLLPIYYNLYLGLDEWSESIGQLIHHTPMHKWIHIDSQYAARQHTQSIHISMIKFALISMSTNRTSPPVTRPYNYWITIYGFSMVTSSMISSHFAQCETIFDKVYPLQLSWTHFGQQHYDRCNLMQRSDHHWQRKSRRKSVYEMLKIDSFSYSFKVYR